MREWIGISEVGLLTNSYEKREALHPRFAPKEALTAVLCMDDNLSAEGAGTFGELGNAVGNVRQRFVHAGRAVHSSPNAVFARGKVTFFFCWRDALLSTVTAF